MIKKKVVLKLVENEAFYLKEGRKYSQFKNTEKTLLRDFDLNGYYNWIDDHKRQIQRKKTVQ